MIFLNSRYADPSSEVVTVTTEDSATRAVVRRPPTRTGDTTWYEYMWREGDRIDLVASRLLNSADLWWYLMDANPELPDPLGIVPGTRLRVPARV